MFFFLFQDPSWDPMLLLVIMYLLSSLFLFFMTLTFLEYLLFCRISLNLTSSDIFSSLGWDCALLKKMPQRQCTFLSAWYQKVNDVLLILTLITWLRCYWSRSFIAKITDSPFFITKYFGKYTLRLCKYPIST